MNTSHFRKISTSILSAALIGAIAFTSGCATPSGQHSGADFIPLIDNPTQAYAVDLFNCQEYAKDNSTMLKNAAINVAAGVLGGAATSAVFRGNPVNRKALMVTGGVAGAVMSAVISEKKDRYAVVNCMRSKGYDVLP